MSILRKWQAGMLFALLVIVPALAMAQAGSTTASLSGIVTDKTGGVIPGATVVLTNVGTGTKATVITNETGAYSVPALDPGTYSATISLSGFKTAVAKDIRLTAAGQGSLNVVLEVGGLEQTIEVIGSSELVQTQSTTVTANVTMAQLDAQPLTTRNTVYALTILPGVNTQDSARNATIGGLPGSSLNVTVDGISVRDQLVGNGFFAMIPPTADSVEEVALTTATSDAQSSGQGAVTLRFVTRSGSNDYKGTAYEYFRHQALNTEYWFDKRAKLPKAPEELNQFGFSFGGPLVKDRVFFFLTFEEFLQAPNTTTRTRTILNPNAQKGIFSYSTSAGTQAIDLLALAAAKGQTNTADPTIGALVAKVQSITSNSALGTILETGNVNTRTFSYQPDSVISVPQPVAKFDANLTSKNHLSGSVRQHLILRDPDFSFSTDPAYPTLTNSSTYKSPRTTVSLSLRTTIGNNLVNDITGGLTKAPLNYDMDVSADRFKEQQGFSLSWPLSTSSTNGPTSGTQRDTPSWSVDDSISWLKGRHNFTFGGNYSHFRIESWAKNNVASVAFGVQSSLDPADAMFTQTNFPGASTSNLTDARSLYAFLTGRITSISSTAVINDQTQKYDYIGTTHNNIALTEYALFAQDQWRITPKLTLNYGARWEVQPPAYAVNNGYTKATVADLCGVSGVGTVAATGRVCNLGQPGVLTGSAPQLTALQPGYKGYNTDFNNIAPTVGVAWRPGANKGLMRRLLGDPQQATVRVSWSIAYNRENLSGFQSVFTGNPGRTTSATRSQTNSNLVLSGETWPILLREASRLGPPSICGSTVSAACMPASPAYPINPGTSNSLIMFDPNLKLGYTQSFSVGLQRPINKDMVVEVRYIHTQTENVFTSENYNALIYNQNGFLDEFKLAQANLYANVAAGRGQTFAYFGAGSGTSPLPILLAHFNAVAKAQSGDNTLYKGSNWTSTTYVNALNQLNPSPGTFVSTGANGLYGNATLRANGQTAGLPVNFWLLNPDASGANFETNGPKRRFDSVQAELRRRFAKGLSVNANFSYEVQKSSTNDSIFKPYVLDPDTGGVPKALKISAVWDLPFGHGRHFGKGSSHLANALLGGWTSSWSGRIQSGNPSRLSGIRLVGMTEKDLQDAFKIRIDPDTQYVWDLPTDIINNTIMAYSSNISGYTAGTPTGRYIAPASTAGCVYVYRGDCGSPRYVTVRGPIIGGLDLNFKKRISLGGERRSLELGLDIFNVTNAIKFSNTFTTSTTLSSHQVTSAYQDLGNSNTADPGGRVMQLMMRFNF